MRQRPDCECGATADTTTHRRLTLALAALLALAIVRLWLMPLPSSFWTHEANAVSLVRYGASHPSLAASPQLADSIYNVLPRIADAPGGFSESVYRLSSTLALGLALYPVRGRVYPFPYRPSPGAESFAAALAQSALRTSNRFVVYGHRSDAHFWENWFRRRPDLAGWSDRRLGPFGEVVVVEFDRPKGT